MIQVAEELVSTIEAVETALATKDFHHVQNAAARISRSSTTIKHPAVTTISDLWRRHGQVEDLIHAANTDHDREALRNTLRAAHEVSKKLCSPIPSL